MGRGGSRLSELWRLTPVSPLAGDAALLIAATGWCVFFMLGYMLNGLAIGLALGSLFFLFGPGILNTYLLYRRVQKFRGAFEFGVEIMLTALGIGLPIREALMEASQHAPEPVRTEFKHTADEISIGAREEDAFMSLARRIPCSETEEMSDAIGLYRNVGGAKALEMIRAVLINLREGTNAAFQVQQHVKGAKFAAVMITVIPIIYFIGMLVFAPDLFGPLFNTPSGQAIFTIAMCIFAAGIWLVYRIIASIEHF